MRIKDVIAFTLFAFYSNLLAVIIFFSHFLQIKLNRYVKNKIRRCFGREVGPMSC